MKINEFIKRFPQHREEIEERAAIMEYDGGLNREAAEKYAVFRLNVKYKLQCHGMYWEKLDGEFDFTG